MRYKREFIEFMLAAEALKFGSFVTKSGRESPYFINTGAFKTGAQIGRLGTFYAAAIVAQMNEGCIPERIDAVFGPAYKGIPLAVSVAIALSSQYGIDVGCCFNRKEAKDHGEGGSLVGAVLKDGDQILIIDDVITAGTAIREVLPMIRSAADVRIAGLLISVDRMERGQTARSAADEIRNDLSIPVFPIVTVREIIDTLSDVPPGGESLMDAAQKAAMEAYLRKFGA